MVYAAAGKASLALQTYQTDLLKDLDQSKRLSPEAVLELCRATDLALRSTKQMATAIV